MNILLHTADYLQQSIGNTITEADRKYKQSIDTYIREHGLEHDVYAPGFRSDIADILAATDCVIVPSYEGLGLVAMEAMCAKTNVVAQECGGSIAIQQIIANSRRNGTSLHSPAE